MNDATCNADCTLPATADCGNGQLDPDEQCDDNNTDPGDTCEPNCTLPQVPTCGNGALDAGEQCDDNNNISGDGCAANCFDEPGGFDLSDIQPRLASRATGAVLQVLGNAILAPVDAQLEDCLNANAPPVALTTTFVDPSGAAVELVLDPDPLLPQSLYRVAGLNGDGQQDTTECIFQISALPPPTVTNAVPPFAFAGRAGDGVLSDATIQVSGTGFVATPSVRFVPTANTALSFQANLVSLLSATELTVVVPSESRDMPVGTYFVFVTNPDGLEGQYLVDDGNGGQAPGLFEVRDVAPPSISNIDPQRSPGTSDVVITVTGTDFVQGAVVNLILDEAGTVTADIPTTMPDPLDPTRLQFTLATSLGLANGIYPVRITNPDTQFDVYFVYEQTDSSVGHLNAAFQATSVALTVGRERHGAVEGFDVFGQSHIFVAGGMDQNKNVLGSVERGQISVFGTPSAFAPTQQYGGPTDEDARQDNTLNTARAGLSLVRAGSFLYAVGGTTDDPLNGTDTPALNTIERARVLGFETQPFLSEPMIQQGSGLANGTWFYRVSAVSSEGEGLASREVFAQGGGVMRICWSAVPGSTSYNIYRSLAADGRFGTTRLLVPEFLATPNANGLLCFDDNGQNDVPQSIYRTPAPGRLAGSIGAGGSLTEGTWSYRVAAVRDDKETIGGYRTSFVVDATSGNTISLRWDIIPNATYNLYRVENANDPPGSEKLLGTELTANSFVDDGSAGFADNSRGPREGVDVLPPGTLSRWEVLPITLAEAREGPDAVILTAFDGDLATTNDPTYLYVTGGKASHLATVSLRTTERALVDFGTGALINPVDNAAVTLAVSSTLLNTGRAYFPLLTNQGQLITPFAPPPQEPPCGDVDGDGFLSTSCGGDDCNDANVAVFPGAPEQCSNGIDDDCDALADCDDPDAPPAGCAGDALCACDPAFADSDGDGHLRAPLCGDDCNDDSSATCGNAAGLDPPDCAEACGGGADEDCDGAIDCFDSDCATAPNCLDACATAVDGDGDGELLPPCGNDCDDTDPTVCSTACDEVQCDGIDQDCSGVDFCFLPGNVTGGTGGSGGLVSPLAANFQLVAETNDPILLVACAGDANYAANNNSGLQTFEVATINPVDGELVAWTLQSETIPRDAHGQDALLFFDFLYNWSGVARESAGGDPAPDNGQTTRVPFDVSPANANAHLGGRQSASSTLSPPRTYASITRLNAKLFAIGGNDGNGAVSTVTRNSQ